VVLGCNNYEIIDLGVMVPAEKIIAAAKEHNVDVIGLSGLITPSLDEMVYMAEEMEREGFDIPLLIGGATTSKVHTAVKIDEKYTKGQTVHVLDASKSVTVVGELLSGKKDVVVGEIKADYKKVRENYAKKKGIKKFLTIEQARQNKFKIDFTKGIKKPNFVGVKSYADPIAIGFDLEELTNYIDWTPFFYTWEMRKKYPEILNDEVLGVEATKLFNDAQQMLKTIIEEKWLTAKAIIGIWAANTVDDDTIEIYTDDTRQTVLHKQYALRQQIKKAKNAYNHSVADFIAPKSSGVKDYIGGFVVTTGLGIENKIAEFEADHNDYKSILLKALADRLAEAFAEKAHEIFRQDLWGYEKEPLSKADLIKEKYVGIRPAPGYPANPDHTEKTGLFEILNATELTGVNLTESLAMYPTASVSGWYFAHPQSKYFGVGKIKLDQVQDIATKKNMDINVYKRWLSSNLE